MMRRVNITHALLAVYLLTLLAVPKVQSPLVAILCLLCLAWGQWREAPPVGQRLRENWAMAVPLVGYASLFTLQILAGWLRWRDWDQVLICALSMGVLVSLVPGRGPAVHRWLLPAAALGAIGACALSAWQYFHLGIPRPPGHLGAGPVGNGALKFGDLSAVLGLFALQMALRGTGHGQRVLGGLGFAAGLGAVALTQARGALLGAMLALVVLAFLLWREHRARRLLAGEEAPGAGAASGQHATASIGAQIRALSRRPSSASGRRQRLKLALAAVLGLAVLAGPVEYMGARFADIAPQFERFEAGDNYSEVGQRLTLWGIALRAGHHAPLTGVGFDGFGPETQRQRDSGELSREAIVLYQGPHNEYLAGLASAGIPGLLVIVLFFWAPLWVGCRRFLRGQRPEESLMLVLLTASYAAFTMTDSLLDRQISLLAYMLLASWLMAASRDTSSPEAVSDGSRRRAGGAGAVRAARAAGAPGSTAGPVGAVGAAGSVGAAGAAGAAGDAAPTDASEGAGSTKGVALAEARPAFGGLAVPGGLSVAIITRDEAHRIARCLESVSFADQIVVLDSGSTDDTVAIARRLGAEVEVTPDWPGFGAQKNRALERCRHRWVLSIDADEQVSDELAAEMLRVLRAAPGASPEGHTGRRGISGGAVASTTEAGAAGAGAGAGASGTATSGVAASGDAAASSAAPAPAIAGYWLRRSSRYCGQVISHGLWGNDRVLRLFSREHGRFTNDRVHEHLICQGGTRVLRGILLHDSVDSPQDARDKARRYAFLGAQSLRNRGRGSTLRGIEHAAWSFLRGYVLRAGFLDGRYGFVLACLNAAGTFWKYHWAALPEARWKALNQQFGD